MRTFFVAAALAAVPSGIFAVPVAENKGDRFIVTLKGCTASETSTIESVASTLAREDSVVHRYNKLCGFAADLTPSSLAALKQKPEVQSVERDGIATVSQSGGQGDATWGLQRITQHEPLDRDDISLTYNYTYAPPAGAGVDVFVIDTGIRDTHEDFGGRATMEVQFGGYPLADGNGHGTHCASTIGGTQFGVAKEVRLRGVKVLSDTGSGRNSDIIAGIDYVVAQHEADRGSSTVINLSLGGSTSAGVNSAVQTAVGLGIHVIAAAGNDAKDACSVSPASAPNAITVAASNVTDHLAYYSNWGTCVDIIAPGSNITGAWFTSDSATNTISGTSMAAPHVAGTVAYILSQRGGMSPAEMAAELQSVGTAGVIDLGTIGASTPNVLLYRPYQEVDF